MCLTIRKSFNPPIKEMIGWKVLVKTDRGYETPCQFSRIKKKQKYLCARGSKSTTTEISGDTVVEGGYIHCWRTRSKARRSQSFIYNEIVVKVKCYNVKAFGDNNDLVCDKIEFLWGSKT